VCDHFGIRAFVCINKYDLNEGMAEVIQNYCLQKGYKMAGRIPYDEKVLEALKAKKPVVLYSGSPAAAAIEELYVNVMNSM
jgi:MinD superfamily P-loop ATPase